MSRLLYITSSARKTRSLSRKLGQNFIEKWQQERPNNVVVERDVGFTSPSAITEVWIAAAFTPQGERSLEQQQTLEESDKLITELRSADIIVIATPMYNYGMPASLKAWVDQVVRVNETFSFDLARGDQPLEPILKGKTLVLLTSCGEFGFAPGGVNEIHSHLVPHVRTVSKYFGVETFHHIGIEFQEFGDARHETSKDQAFHAAEALATKLSKE